LAASEEKYTEAVTALISTSIPALAAACFTMACVFCRGALIEVWYTTLSLTPSLARMPSPPFFQPAASRICAALSGLNSNRLALERKRSGALRKLAVATPVRP
jgi:hypothetical protein